MLSFVTTWMDVEEITLNKTSWTEINASRSPFIWNLKELNECWLPWAAEDRGRKDEERLSTVKS